MRYRLIRVSVFETVLACLLKVYWKRSLIWDSVFMRCGLIRVSVMNWYRSLCLIQVSRICCRSLNTGLWYASLFWLSIDTRLFYWLISINRDDWHTSLLIQKRFKKERLIDTRLFYWLICVSLFWISFVGLQKDSFFSFFRNDWFGTLLLIDTGLCFLRANIARDNSASFWQGSFEWYRSLFV